MSKPVAGFNANPQNINTKGRPPRSWTFSGLLEDALEEQDETGESYKSIITKKLRTLGSKGDMIAIKEIMNRLDGMPKQDIDLKGEVKSLITLDTKEGDSNESK